VKCRKDKYSVKIAMLAVSFMLPLLLTGCWNNRDLTEINIVSAFGIDRTEDGKVLLTAQVVEPAAIQSTASGKGKGGGTQPKPVFVESYEGETVFEAIRGMLSIVDKRLFLSTARVLILGERLSKDGINEVLDFFQRDHEVEYKMDVLVARNATPKEILEMETDIDSIPAVYIKGKVKSTIVNIPADNGKISMEVMRSKGKVNVEFKNGEPAMLSVQVGLEANVGEYEAKGKLDSPDNLHRLEETLGEEVKREIRMALDRAKKDYSSDIFGFGTQLHKYHPQYWKKAKDSWNDTFSKLPADIQVDAKISRTGVIKGPIKKDG